MSQHATARIRPLAVGPRAHLWLSLIVAWGACTRAPPDTPQASGKTAERAPFTQPNQLVAVRPDSIVVMAISADTIASIKDSQRLSWIRTFAGETIVAPPEPTPDSSVYLLTNKHLRALDPSGRIRFRIANPFLRNSEDTRGTLTLGLAALPDSGVAVSDGRTMTVKFNRKGQLRWRHSVPHDDNMAGHPAAGPNGSLYIHTASWLYVIGPDGRERWRVPLKTLRVQ